jgi:uncharacterized membrane protein YebE (DUF533 family)
VFARITQHSIRDAFATPQARNLPPLKCVSCTTTLTSTQQKKGISMGLVSTLTKVALGVVIGKGINHVSRNGLPKLGAGGMGGFGTMLESLGGTSRANSSARAPHASSLGGMLAKAGPALSGLLAAQGLGTAQATPSAPEPSFNQAIVGHETVEPTREQELAAALLLRAMVQAAMADGTMDPAEREKLTQHLQDANAQERAYVSSLMGQPVDIAALAADVPDGMEEQVYLVSLMAIDLDSRAEAQYLHGLASALGLDQPTVNDIHNQAGVPALYA